MVNVLLAVNSKQLEKYISELKEINVLKALKSSRTLAEDILVLKPHVVIISRYLPEELDIKDLVENFPKLNFSGRIIYLYGDEDIYRKQLTNFFIEHGIYDFHVGDIDEEVINKLLFQPKERSDVELEEITEAEEEIFEENKDKDRQSFFEEFQAKELEVHFIEKIEEVERIVEVEKVRVVEKIKEREVIDNSVITLISNAPTGKSFLTWVMSSCFSERHYKTAVINNDRGFSANSYFGVDEITEKNMEEALREEDLEKYFNSAFQVKDNLKILSGSKTSKEHISNKLFLDIIDKARFSNDITIIDCKSEINENTITAVKQSNLVLLVIDLNLAHFNLNYLMIKELKEVLSSEKIIVVINNIIESRNLKLISNYIEELQQNFRNIVTIKNCGTAAYDFMMTEKTPYMTNEAFAKDIDYLLDCIKSRGKNKKQSILKRKLYNSFVNLGMIVDKYKVIVFLVLILYILWRLLNKY